MESLVCLQILRPLTNSQGTNCPVAGHISPPRFELSDPRFTRKNCVGKNPLDHFLSAKTKTRCQLKCCKLNVSMNVKMFIFCTSIWPLRKIFLSQFG